MYREFVREKERGETAAGQIIDRLVRGWSRLVTTFEIGTESQRVAFARAMALAPRQALAATAAALSARLTDGGERGANSYT